MTLGKANVSLTPKISHYTIRHFQLRTIIAKKFPRDWKKIFANNLSDKGLVSRIYEELWKCSNEKNEHLKWANNSKDISSK